MSQHKKLFFPHSGGLCTNPQSVEMYNMAYSEHCAVNSRTRCAGNVAFSCCAWVWAGLLTVCKAWLHDIQQGGLTCRSRQLHRFWSQHQQKKTLVSLLTHALFCCTLYTVNDPTPLSLSFCFHCLTLSFHTHPEKSKLLYLYNRSIMLYLFSAKGCFYSESVLNETQCQ